MPFVGETGGAGLRRRAGTVPDRGRPASTAPPDRPACRSIRPSPSDSRRPAPGRGAPRSRRAAGPATGPDAAMTPRRWAATRTVPTPDPIARDYLLLGPAARPAHPGPRRWLLRAGRPQGPGRHGAAARAGRACATTRSRCATGSPAEVDRARPRDWLDAQLVALETQAAALAGDALPYLEHVDALLRLRAAARPGRPSSTPPRPTSTRCCPGDGPLADRLAAWDAQFVIPVERLPAVVDWLVGALPGARGRRCSACPTARTCGSRSSRTSRGRGYNWYDGGRRSRVDINTDLPGPRAGPHPRRRPRDVSRATTSSTPGRRPTSSTAAAGWKRRSC